MAGYGAIPTSAAPPPAAEGEGGGASSSAMAFMSRAKARGQEALESRRPWKELVHWGAFTLPHSLSDAVLRIRTNLAHFAMNYAIVALVVVFLSLLYHPTSLIVFLALMILWLFLYFLRDSPIVLLGRTVNENLVLLLLAVLTIALLLLTGVTSNVLVSLAVAVAVVLIHAVFRRTDDLYHDDGRAYGAEVAW